MALLCFRFASNVFPDLGRSVRLKIKRRKKKNKKSQNRKPWYSRMTLKVNIYIFGLTKSTIHCKKVPVFVPVFSMLLLCSFSRLKELFQVKNGLTMLLLFF